MRTLRVAAHKIRASQIPHSRGVVREPREALTSESFKITPILRLHISSGEIVEGSSGLRGRLDQSFCNRCQLPPLLNSGQSRTKGELQVDSLVLIAGVCDRPIEYRNGTSRPATAGHHYCGHFLKHRAISRLSFVPYSWEHGAGEWVLVGTNLHLVTPPVNPLTSAIQIATIDRGERREACRSDSLPEFQ